MPKKQTQKVMTVELEKTPIPAVENVKSALNSLEASTGWAIVRKIMDENIKYLEVAILEKIEPVTKEGLSDAEVEICRYKRNLNIALRDTPKNYRAKLDETGIVPKDFDPYFKTKAEMDKPPVED